MPLQHQRRETRKAMNYTVSGITCKTLVHHGSPKIDDVCSISGRRRPT